MPNGLFGKAVVNANNPQLISTTPNGKLRTANINVLATATTAVDIAVTTQQFQNTDFESYFNVNTNASLENFRTGINRVENGTLVIHPREYGIPDTTSGAGALSDSTKNYFMTTDGVTFTRVPSCVEYVRHETSGIWYYITPDGQRRTWDQWKAFTTGTSGTSYTNNNWTHIVRAGTATDQNGAILFKRGFSNVQYSTNMRTAGAFSWSAAYTVTQGGTIEHIVWMNGTTRFYLGMSSALVHFATAAPTAAANWNNTFLTMPAGHSSKLRGGMRLNNMDVLWFDDNKIATGADNTATFTYMSLPGTLTAAQIMRIEPDDSFRSLRIWAKNGDFYYTSNLSTWTLVEARGPQTTNYTKAFTVTVASSAFNIDGVSKPALRLIRGYTYRFEQDLPSNSGQVIRFKDADGNVYTTGVTTTGTAGTPNAETVFVVPATAPATLTYESTAGGATYGAAITISDDIVTPGVITGTVNHAVKVVNNEFVINNVAKPTLVLIKGYTYVFDVSDSSNVGKVLSFRDSSNAAFSTGVTTNGSPGTSGANVQFTVPATATDTMTYLDTTIGSSSGGSLTVMENNIIAVFENLNADASLKQLASVTASGKLWTRERRFFNIPADSYIEKGFAMTAGMVLEKTAVMASSGEQVIVASSANGTVARMHGIEE